MEIKFVTVLMSVYNEEESKLIEAIESMLKQTYQNFDFIVVEDGFNEQVDKILKRYSKIQIILNQENIGLDKSLNKALKYINTPYIIRMDSDDISMPNRVEKQIKFVKQNPQYSVVGTRAAYFDKNGIFKTTSKYGNIDAIDLSNTNHIIHPSVIIKTSDLKEIGGYQKYKKCEDYATWFECILNHKKLYIMNDVLLKYRQGKKDFKRRKYRDKIVEYKVKKKYITKLKIPVYKKIIYILKPLIGGLMPNFLYIYNRYK